MILEQIAWACKVDQYDDVGLIKGTSATRAVSHLSKINTAAGELYGWLSSHVHWESNGHLKAWDIQEEDGEQRLSMLFVSPEFKSKSLALTLLLSKLAIESFFALRHNEIGIVLKSGDRALQIDPKKKSILGISTQPSCAELGKIRRHSSLLRLLKAIEGACPADTDVRKLSKLAHRTCA